jgi:hypothetical protein
MSEPPPSNDDDPSKKGKRKNPNTYAQKGLGSFGIKRSKKIVHRGRWRWCCLRWRQLSAARLLLLTLVTLVSTVVESSRMLKDLGLTSSAAKRLFLPCNRVLLRAAWCLPFQRTFHLEANVFMCFVPPGCTDSTQAIDAGAGRSTRVYVGDKLDKWLEVDGNLEKWEKGLKAKERRILMTHWLAAAKK